MKTEDIFKEAFSQIGSYKVIANPSTQAGKNQRKFIELVNSKISTYPPTDTVIEFFKIDVIDIMSNLNTTSVDSWGINPVWWERNQNPTIQQLIDRCVNDILTHIWHEVAKSINRDKFISLHDPPSKFYFKKIKSIK